LILIGSVSHGSQLNYVGEELKRLKILSALDMLSPVYDPSRSRSMTAADGFGMQCWGK
jgi:hypothetical protein